MKITQIKLVDPATDKEILIKVNKLNGIVFNQLNVVEGKFRDIRKEANLLTIMASKPEDMKALMGDDDEQMALVEPIIKGIVNGTYTINDVVSMMEQGESGIYLANMERRIEVIKIMGNLKGVADEIATLFNEPFSGDFWQGQDWEELAEQADNFRSLLRR